MEPINYIRRILIVLGILFIAFMTYAAITHTPGIRNDY